MSLSPTAIFTISLASPPFRVMDLRVQLPACPLLLKYPHYTNYAQIGVVSVIAWLRQQSASFALPRWYPSSSRGENVNPKTHEDERHDEVSVPVY